MDFQKSENELAENTAFNPACGDSSVQSMQKSVQPLGNKGPVHCGPFYFPRNTAAIWSYYLGVASLLFCFFTGIPALITGICGLVHAHRYPEGRGIGHSIFGIVMGSVSIVSSLVFLIVTIANS